MNTFCVELVYPNGAPVLDANLQMSVAENTVSLEGIGGGRYSTIYSDYSESGISDIEFYAIDSVGNHGFMRTTVEFSQSVNTPLIPIVPLIWLVLIVPAISFLSSWYIRMRHKRKL